MTSQSKVYVTAQETVFEQQSKGEYAIPSSDGGTIYTELVDVDDENFPFPYDLVFQKRNPDGTLGPAVTLVEEGETTRANFADIAVNGGGAVYALDISHDDQGFFTRTLELDYIDAAGQNTRTTLDTFSFGDGPYPSLYPSEPTLTHYSNSTFTVGWTEQYSEGDPNYGPYDNPTTTASFLRLYSDDGTLLRTTTVDFDGSSLSSTYASSGRLAQTQLKTKDGVNDFTYYDPTTGQETGEFVRYADGSRKIVDLTVTGKAYAEQIASYDAHGTLVSMTRIYANGVIAFTQVNNRDGTGAVANYDPSGRATTSIAFAADGSRDVTLRSYAGAGTTPATVEVDHYGTDNKRAFSNIQLADGSHRQTAATAGVTLTSTPGVTDTFRAAAAGGDTFVFAPGFGQDLITNFHAGSGSGHDIADFSAFHVVLGSNQSQADYLAQHLKQSGRDAVLTITPNDVLTLKNIAIASLTADDVKV